MPLLIPRPFRVQRGDRSCLRIFCRERRMMEMASAFPSWPIRERLAQIAEFQHSLEVRHCLRRRTRAHL